LASYDLVAKRIRDLPTQTSLENLNTNASASGQDRLQKAIYNRAALYLGEKMAYIKTMGSLQPDPATFQKSERPAREQTKNGLPDDDASSEADKIKDEEKAARLAVLYEQEALVSGYLDDAAGRREFEDADALKTSLDDLSAPSQTVYVC
jgi:hypothetical protein